MLLPRRGRTRRGRGLTEAVLRRNLPRRRRGDEDVVPFVPDGSASSSGDRIVVDGIMLQPCEQFLDRLWDGKLAGAA